MKLKSLHIDSYRHLENLDFDFTYPKGHEKEGEPLEKICIIGQSATGKTGLLELIKEAIQNLDLLETVDHKYLTHNGNPFIKIEKDVKFSFLINGNFIGLSKNGAQKNDKIYTYSNSGGSIHKLITDVIRLVYITSDILSQKNINILKENPLLLIEYFKSSSNLNQSMYRSQIHEFSEEISDNIWYDLLKEILNYRTKFNTKVGELMAKGAILDLKKFNNSFEAWKNENRNPLLEFANTFNKILKKLNLEIDLTSTEFSIPIKSLLNEEVIPISGLSTGTKGLLLSGLPLYKIDTKDAVILLDEPERSLFPDLQIDLMTHYKNLAPEAQFIVATHSPFIAAAFEDYERFILYFDDKGKVKVRKGESPIGDDPNDMLSNDFNVDYYNEFGKAAHKKYLALKKEAAQETEPKRKKELIVELAELGDKYNF